MKTPPSPPHLKRLGGKMCLKYDLTVPHWPYGGTEAGARVPPIALNRFSRFLLRAEDMNTSCRGVLWCCGHSFVRCLIARRVAVCARWGCFCGCGYRAQRRRSASRELGGNIQNPPAHPDAMSMPTPTPQPPPKLEPKNQSIISHSRPCNHIHPSTQTTHPQPRNV